MPDCIFCDIVARKIPSRIEYEDDTVIAFHDINPAATHHLLIIPKKHLANVRDASPDDEMLLGHLMRNANVVAEKLGFAEQGYQILIRNGRDAGQEVMHLHMHVLSGRKF